MATTMNLIAKQTVGSGGAASVTFSNIPQTFTDLKLVISARTTRTGTDLQDELFIQFNGNTSSYTTMMLEGNGSATRSATYSAQTKLLYGAAPTDNSTANTFSNCEYYIPNYTSSNNKSVSYESTAENNATGTLQYLTAGLWGNSAAITSITITAYGTFDQYTTAYLYGISNSSTQNTLVPLASGGDIISTNGTYWFHTFLYSGTFTPLKNLTCDYLVVAGGGGGGGKVNTGNPGGGGGAGGYRTSIGGTALSLTSQAYTVTVGAGGNGGTSTVGSNGTSSVFSSITSSGGGAGGSEGYAPIAGGSGGGGGAASNSTYRTAAAGNTGSYSPVEGYAGGNGWSSSPYEAAGGGGGASQVGYAGVSNTQGGAGGNGNSNSISGSSITYAGGGAGGAYTGASATGGTGGGGNANNGNGTAGTANRGGGGGGAGGSGTYSGGNGGSGIVIVRYAV